MQRLILLAENERLEEVFKEYEQYMADLIRNHTKMYYVKIGRFYVTKFNPDAAMYEDYIQKTSNPFIQTMSKVALDGVANKLSGLNILEETEYKVVESQEKGMVGIVFNPLSEERLEQVLRVINEE